MKRTMRLISLLVCLCMVLPLCLTAVGATDAAATDNTASTEKDLTLENLGWVQDTTGYTGTSYALSATDQFGADGNKALKLTEKPGNWCGVRILSADKLAGVTKYSIAADIQYNSATTFAIRFGDESNNGDCFGISWNTTLWNALTSENNNGASTIANCDKIGTEKRIALRAEIDTTAGTVTVFIGDEQVSTRSDATKTVGGIYLMLRGLDGYMDNIVVKNTETNAVIYSEDFEGYKLPEETFDVMNGIGWKQDTKGFTGTSYQLDITDQFGASGNKALKITEASANWCGVQLVSAEDMAGVTKYSISADVKYLNAATLAFRFGDESNKGDCFGISWNTRLWNATTADNDKGAASVENCDKIGAEKALALRVEVDATAGTAVAYVNDEKVTERTDATKAVGGIYLMLRNLVAYMDNIVVKNLETDAVIYSEDFESYPLTEKSAPTRPAADYTGRKAGEVIFSDNYDAAKTVDDLYYVYEPNTGFGQATWTLSDKINGTSCAQITGAWSQVEIVPAEVCATYEVYTIHMTLKFDSNTNRFSIMYNSDTRASNSNSGFFEMRYLPLTIESLGITGGTILKDQQATPINAGDVFELALTVDCVNGTTIAYINGEYLSFVSGVNKNQSAIWIVAQNAVGYVDNVMVTAGTYAEYQVAQAPDEDDTSAGGDQSTAETPTTETPTTEQPTTEQPTTEQPTTETPTGETSTDASDEGGDKGCASSVTALLPVMLVGCVGAALLGRRKEQ